MSQLQRLALPNSILASLVAIAAAATLCAAPPSHPAPVPAAQSQQFNLPPFDPFEPVTTQPEPVTSRETSTALNRLLARALQGNIAALYLFSGFPIPYDAKILFTSLGDNQYIGPGDMESSQNADRARHWTLDLGSFSMSRILTPPTPATEDRPATPGSVYDLGWTDPIPLRAHMIRADVLDVPRTLGAFRTAAATLNGTQLTCILSSTGRETAPGRDWWETEYCIDPVTDLLRIYSGAPGIYYFYDYDNAQNFHGRVVPSSFKVAEAGQIVLQGAISVTDPTAEELNPKNFTPTNDMYGKGVYCSFPTYIHTLSRSPSATLTSSGQTQQTPSQQAPPEEIIVHAILSPDGTVVDADALQSPQSPAAQSAVAQVKRTKFEPDPPAQNPNQREIFVFIQ